MCEYGWSTLGNEDDDDKYYNNFDTSLHNSIGVLSRIAHSSQQQRWQYLFAMDSDDDDEFKNRPWLNSEKDACFSDRCSKYQPLLYASTVKVNLSTVDSG